MRYCIILVLVLSKVDVMLCCLVVWLPQAVRFCLALAFWLIC